MPNPPKDETKAASAVDNPPPTNPDPSVAPDVPQSDLVLKTIRDLIKDNKFTPDLEKQLGMSKDEADQFVKKFEKREQPKATEPGREIKVKPGEDEVIKDLKAPEFNTSATVSSRNQRQGSSLPQDTLGGLSEGNRSSPPIELRRQWEAYRKGLSTTKPAAPGK